MSQKCKKRPAITVRMKIDCLLDRIHQQFGVYLKCGLSGEELKPGDPIQFDHVHALGLDGPHTYRDIRPVQIDPHKRKSKRDVQDIARADRIAGGGRKRRGRKLPKGRKLQGGAKLKGGRNLQGGAKLPSKNSEFKRPVGGGNAVRRDGT